MAYSHSFSGNFALIITILAALKTVQYALLMRPIGLCVFGGKNLAIILFLQKKLLAIIPANSLVLFI